MVCTFQSFCSKWISQKWIDKLLESSQVFCTVLKGQCFEVCNLFLAVLADFLKARATTENCLFLKKNLIHCAFSPKYLALKNSALTSNHPLTSNASEVLSTRAPFCLALRFCKTGGEIYGEDLPQGWQKIIKKRNRGHQSLMAPT